MRKQKTPSVGKSVAIRNDPVEKDLRYVPDPSIPSDPNSKEFLLSLPTATLEARAHNLSGQIFGRLTALKPIRNSKKQLCWVCRCSCGNITAPRSCRLISGNTKSCGCWNIEEISRRNKINITGKTFWQLHALYTIARKHKGNCVWMCRCSCGKFTTAATSDITSGVKKSCGCRKRVASTATINKLNASARTKGPNHPNWNPEYTDADRKYRRPSITLLNEINILALLVAVQLV